MRARTLLILLIAVTISVVGIGSAGSKGKSTAGRSLNSAYVPKVSAALSKEQSNDIADGAINPDLIPDQAAYTLLLRLLSDRHTDEQKTLIRSYINQMNLGDADALLTLAEEFEERVGVLDRKAEKIHEKNGPNLNSRALAQLNELQQRKKEIVADIVASIPTRLGAYDMEKLRRHIDQRVKPKTKLYPDHIHQ